VILPNSNSKKYFGIIIISICSILVAIYLVTNYTVIYLSNDTAQYISTARNLLEGNGLKTDLLYYEQQLTGEIPAPQTIWPPGYPAVLASLLWLNLDFAYVPFLAALAFHLASFFLLYEILRSLSIPSIYCVAGVFVWQISVLANLYVLMGLSESAFIFFSLLSLYLFFNGSTDSKYDALFLFLSGLCSAIGFSIRYVGIALIGSLICCLFMLWLIKRQKRHIKELFIFCLIPFLTVIFVFGRNLILSDSLTGGPMIEQAFTTYEFIGAIWWAVKNISGFYGGGYLFYFGLSLFMGSFFIWLSIMILSECSFIKQPLRLNKFFVERRILQESKQNPNCVLIPLLLYVFFLISMIFLYALSNNPSFFSARFLVPLVPVVIIVVLYSSVHSNNTKNTRLIRLIHVLLVFMFVSYIAGQVLNSVRLHKKMDALIGHNMIYSSLFAKMNNDVTLYDFFRGQLCSNCPVLAVDGQFLGMILNRPVIGLANSNYTHKIWTEQAVMELTEKYKVKYICLFYNGEKRPAYRLTNRPFVKKLYEKNSIDWLSVVSEHPKFLLYRIHIKS